MARSVRVKVIPPGTKMDPFLGHFNTTFGASRLSSHIESPGHMTILPALLHPARVDHGLNNPPISAVNTFQSDRLKKDGVTCDCRSSTICSRNY
jgi:hypothetical protein